MSDKATSYNPLTATLAAGTGGIVAPSVFLRALQKGVLSTGGHNDFAYQFARKLGKEEQAFKYGVKKLGVLSGASNAASSLGALTALLARNEDTARHGAEAGTVGGLINLGGELGASSRGARVLAEAHIPGKAKAFIGVPVYATLAMIPALTYLIKKHFGGYKKNNNVKLSHACKCC